MAPHFGGNPRYDQDPGCSCSYGHSHVTDKMLLSMARELGVAERAEALSSFDKAQEFLQPDPSHADSVLGRTQKKPL